MVIVGLNLKRNRIPVVIEELEKQMAVWFLNWIYLFSFFPSYI